MIKMQMIFRKSLLVGQKFSIVNIESRASDWSNVKAILCWVSVSEKAAMLNLFLLFDSTICIW